MGNSIINLPEVISLGAGIIRIIPEVIDNNTIIHWWKIYLLAMGHRVANGAMAAAPYSAFRYYRGTTFIKFALGMTAL